MFVSRERVPVTIDGLDVIYIKPKMSYGSKQRVTGAAARSVTKRADGTMDAELDIGRMNLVLLVENILDWEGPSFVDEHGRKIPVNEKTIDQLDPDKPLLDKVLAEINERNKAKEPAPTEEGGSRNGVEADMAVATPKNSASAGSTSSKGTSKSRP